MNFNNGLLREIGASAFQGGTKLAEVTFPENAIEIGANTFSHTIQTRCHSERYDALTPGLYIVGGRKMLVK